MSWSQTLSKLRKQFQVQTPNISGRILRERYIKVLERSIKNYSWPRKKQFWVSVLVVVQQVWPDMLECIKKYCVNTWLKNLILSISTGQTGTSEQLQPIVLTQKSALLLISSLLLAQKLLRDETSSHTKHALCYSFQTSEIQPPSIKNVFFMSGDILCPPFLKSLFVCLICVFVKVILMDDIKNELHHVCIPFPRRASTSAWPPPVHGLWPD